MTKIVKLMLILLLLAKTGLSQEALIGQAVKGKEIIYMKINEPNAYGTITVSNTDNVLYKTKQFIPFNGHYPNENLFKLDKKKLFSIIANTFSPTRLAKLEKETETFFVTTYFLPDGTLKELTFGVNEGSSLDVLELENIEQTLKKEIHGWYEYDDPEVRSLQKSNYIVFTFYFIFKSLLEYKEDPDHRIPKF